MNLHEFTVYLEIFRVRRRYEEGHKKAYWELLWNYCELLGSVGILLGAQPIFRSKLAVAFGKGKPLVQGHDLRIFEGSFDSRSRLEEPEGFLWDAYGDPI